jgi:hypothetical protein
MQMLHSHVSSATLVRNVTRCTCVPRPAHIWTTRCVNSGGGSMPARSKLKSGSPSASCKATSNAKRSSGARCRAVTCIDGRLNSPCFPQLLRTANTVSVKRVLRSWGFSISSTAAMAAPPLYDACRAKSMVGRWGVLVMCIWTSWIPSQSCTARHSSRTSVGSGSPVPAKCALKVALAWLYVMWLIGTECLRLLGAYFYKTTSAYKSQVGIRIVKFVAPEKRCFPQIILPHTLSPTDRLPRRAPTRPNCLFGSGSLWGTGCAAGLSVVLVTLFFWRGRLGRSGGTIKT